MHTSSAPLASAVRLLFKMRDAISSSIPASFNTPMIPNTEITSAQVGRMLLMPSTRNPTAALLAGSLANISAGEIIPAASATAVPQNSPTRIPS